VFTDIGRENFYLGVLSAIPIAPKTRASAHIENATNGEAPPGAQRVNTLGKVGNFLGIMYARLSIEALVVRFVELNILRHRLVLSEVVQ
jgi:hypothetical protein